MRWNAGCDMPVKIRNSSFSLSLSRFFERLAGCLDLAIFLRLLLPLFLHLLLLLSLSSFLLLLFCWDAAVSKSPTGAIVFVIIGGKELRSGARKKN